MATAPPVLTAPRQARCHGHVTDSQRSPRLQTWPPGSSPPSSESPRPLCRARRARPERSPAPRAPTARAAPPPPPPRPFPGRAGPAGLPAPGPAPLRPWPPLPPRQARPPPGSVCACPQTPGSGMAVFSWRARIRKIKAGNAPRGCLFAEGTPSDLDARPARREEVWKGPFGSE